MDIKNDKFIVGFNHGYVLSKYDALLLNKILNGLNPANNYIDGLIYGKKNGN